MPEPRVILPGSGKYQWGWQPSEHPKARQMFTLPGASLMKAPTTRQNQGMKDRSLRRQVTGRGTCPPHFLKIIPSTNTAMLPTGEPEASTRGPFYSIGAILLERDQAVQRFLFGETHLAQHVAYSSLSRRFSNRPSRAMRYDCLKTAWSEFEVRGPDGP